MEPYQEAFIAFLVRHGALRFGEFTLKSGRSSPYFLNTGMLHSGEAMTTLGGFYAEAIYRRLGESCNVVFGPAYKGIPLAVAAVCELSRRFGINVDYAFNRKETKDHGDGGLIVGKPLTDSDRVVLVDDVITAGTAAREAAAVLRREGVIRLSGICISVDRREKGPGGDSATAELSRELNTDIFAVVTMPEIIDYLGREPVDGKHILTDEIITKISVYRQQYGMENTTR
jgi:orotate phosphoribosyltransferase